MHYTLILLAALYVFMRWVFPKRAEIAHAYLRYILLAIAAWIILSPFVWLICAAFKDETALMRYMFLPPLSEWSAETINLDNFRELLSGDPSVQGKIYFHEYAVNSLFVACTMTMVQLFFASLGGFALAKYQFRGKKWLMLYMLGTMMLPPMLLLAPVYEMVYQLGWMDTYWALIVPASASVFGLFLFRQAMLGVPDSLLEAARIDGMSEFGIYWHIAMPLVRPMTGAYCLVSFLGAWNAFIGPQIYLHTKAKLTLPVILTHYIGVYQQQYGVFLAGTLLAIIPPAILFFALQKEFVSGLTKGAVKG